MYSVTVRGHMMIAHSLKDPFFGPAQQLHGATYVVDVTFYTKELNAQSVVIDIGVAHEKLNAILQRYNFQNLDALDEFNGKLTTTEYMARIIHTRMASAVNEVFSGKIKVTLGESHIAWASYEA